MAKKNTQPVTRFDWVREHRWFLIAGGLLLAVAAFLRFYELGAFITFLGDQGRDAIVMRRIITFEDFPGIGPRSSVGFIYLGPFYYYLMAPFLGLFAFDPAGPGYGVAFLWIVGIAVFTFILKREWGTIPALVFLFFSTFSYALISLGRFSWNPNLLPVFAMATMYLFLITLRSPQLLRSALAGAALGASLQLHYLTLLILPAWIGVFGFLLWKHRQPLNVVLRNTAAGVAGAVLVYAPFILFEIKNQFLNLRGIPTIFGSRQFETEALYHVRLTEANTGLWNLIFQFDLPHWGAILLSLAFVGYGSWVIWHTWNTKKTIPYLFTAAFTSTVLFVLLFGYVDTPRFIHYYTPIYLMLITVIASIPVYLPRLPALGIISILAVVFLAGNIPAYRFFHQEPNRQTERAKSMAETILSIRGEGPYAVISTPLSNTNHQIRYYLEVLGDRPMAEEDTSVPREAFVLCFYENTDECNPTEEGQYQLAIMDNRTVVEEIPHPPEATIYKIIDSAQ